MYCGRRLPIKVDGEQLLNFERFCMVKDGQPNAARTITQQQYYDQALFSQAMLCPRQKMLCPRQKKLPVCMKRR